MSVNNEERDAGSLRGVTDKTEHSNQSTTAQYTAGALSNNIIPNSSENVKKGRDLSDYLDEDGMFEERNKITTDMNDDDRAKIIKSKKITLPIFNAEEYARIIKDNPNLTDKKLKKTEAKKVLKKIALEFSVFQDYSNADMDLEFSFGKNNLDKSVNTQRGNYQRFAKMLSCFSEVISNAIGVEVHNRNGIGYKPDAELKNMYVLVSAFESSSKIMPVKLEIKEFYNKPNRALCRNST